MSGPHTEDPRPPRRPQTLADIIDGYGGEGALQESLRALSIERQRSMRPFLAPTADLPDPPRPFTEHPPTLTVRTIPYYVPISTAPCETCGATVAYNLSAFADPWHVQPSVLCWSPWPARPPDTD